MTTPKRGRGRPAITSFEDRILQLEGFRQIQGHFNVGIHQEDDDDNLELGKWLGQQRYRFRMGTIDRDRAMQLCNMGVPGFEQSELGVQNSSNNNNKKTRRKARATKPTRKKPKKAANQQQGDQDEHHVEEAGIIVGGNHLNSPGPSNNNMMMTTGFEGPNFAGGMMMGNPALQQQQQYQEYWMYQQQQQFNPMGMSCLPPAHLPQFSQQQQQFNGPGMNMEGMNMDTNMGMAGCMTEEAAIRQQQYAQFQAQQQDMQMQDAFAMQHAGGEHGEILDNHDHLDQQAFHHHQQQMGGGFFAPPQMNPMMIMMGPPNPVAPDPGENNGGSAKRRRARKPRKPTNKHWDVRVQEIVDFRKENGHCDIKISIHDPDNEDLGRWLAGQRCRHRQGNLRPDRSKELADLGCSGFDAVQNESDGAASAN